MLCHGITHQDVASVKSGFAVFGPLGGRSCNVMLYNNAEKPTSGQSVKLCVWKMGFFVVSPVSTNT